MQDATSCCDLGSRLRDSQVRFLEEKASFDVANVIMDGSSSCERPWLHFRRLVGLPVTDSREPIRDDLLRFGAASRATHSAVDVENSNVGKSGSSEGLDGREWEGGEVVKVGVGSSFAIGGEGSGGGGCVGEEVVKDLVSEEDFVVVVEYW